MLIFLHGGRRYLASLFQNIAQRPSIALALTGLLAFIGSVAVGFVVGIKEPSVHDEFSYLLAADTFAHGRLTNPTHPLWVHFESFHIIHQPTYMSKYPPGQGLILAVGQVITGHPIVGAWISMGLMCAAICWMLYAWVPPRWAFLGGIFALVNPQLGIASYWAQSYWGGAVAATGGALVLGGIRRVIRKHRAYDSLLMGIGLAILANSRPYEGLLLSMPAGFILLRWMVSKQKPSTDVLGKRILLPLFIVLTLNFVAMGLYNFRVGGDALRMPYQIHEDTYAMGAPFIWQQPRPEPKYYHQVIREFHETYLLGLHASQRSILLVMLRSLYLLLLVTVQSLNIFAIPLIAAFAVLVRWTWRNRWGLRAVQIFSVLICGMLVSSATFIHYLAPVIGLNYFFILNAIRLWRWRDRKVGQLMLWLMPFLAFAALATSVYGKISQDHSSDWYIQRAVLLRQLTQKDGEHLIIVKYGPQHSVHNEWVYNEADIDHAKVVWARQMTRDEDCKLVDYFIDRHIWSLGVDVDDNPPILKPYPIKLCRDI